VIPFFFFEAPRGLGDDTFCLARYLCTVDMRSFYGIPYTPSNWAALNSLQLHDLTSIMTAHQLRSSESHGVEWSASIHPAFPLRTECGLDGVLYTKKPPQSLQLR
jgi:hypothetical protein